MVAKICLNFWSGFSPSFTAVLRGTIIIQLHKMQCASALTCRLHVVDTNDVNSVLLHHKTIMGHLAFSPVCQIRSTHSEVRQVKQSNSGLIRISKQHARTTKCCIAFSPLSLAGDLSAPVAGRATWSLSEKEHGF